MEKSRPFIINEWLRLIELYTVEYPRNSRRSQSENTTFLDYPWLKCSKVLHKDTPTKQVLELKNGFFSVGSNLANLLYVLSNIHFLLYYIYVINRPLMKKFIAKQSHKITIAL